MSSPASRAYHFTDYLLGILMLILAGTLIFWAARFLQPVRLPPAPPGSYHYIARLDDISPSIAYEFDLEGRPWLLAKTRNGVTAVSGECTFRGSNIRWDHRQQLWVCEGHGCTFGYRGIPIAGLATSPLEKLKIRIIDERIYGARDLS